MDGDQRAEVDEIVNAGTPMNAKDRARQLAALEAAGIGEVTRIE